jgi:hypothetical protein
MMSQKFKNIFFQALPVIVIATLLVTAIIYAWQEPSKTPPQKNAPAPLNVSSEGQTKVGGLILNTGEANIGLIVAKGKVGIGTTEPGEKLTIYAGNFSVRNDPNQTGYEYMYNQLIIGEHKNPKCDCDTDPTKSDCSSPHISPVDKGNYCYDWTEIEIKGRVEKKPASREYKKIASNKVTGGSAHIYNILTIGNEGHPSAYVPQISFNAPGTGDNYAIGDIAGTLHFINNSGISKLVIGQDGNVGIGTTTPIDKLVVQQSGAGGPRVIGAQGQLVGYNYVQYFGSDDWYSWWIWSPNNTGRLQFQGNKYVDGTSQGDKQILVLDYNTGCVGIGTTTPSQKLEVVGNIKATGVCIGNVCRTSWPTAAASYWTQTGNYLYTSSTAWNVGIGTTNLLGKLTIEQGYGDWLSLRASQNNVLWRIHNPSEADRFEIGVYDAPNGVTRWGLLTIKRDTGNVGIGTTEPYTYKLAVAGDIGIEAGKQISFARNLDATSLYYGARLSGNNVQIYTYDASGRTIQLGVGNGATTFTPKVTMLNNGNVGIGTTAPGARLTVVSTGGTGWEDVDGNAEVHIGTQMASAGTPGEKYRLALQPYGHTGGPFNIVNRDTADSAYLDVRYGTGGTLFTIKHDGNVGIGTTAPNEKLQVVGNIKLGGTEGDIKDVNQIIGYNDLFLKGNSAETAPVYLAGSQLSLYTSKTERLRVDSAGNVGIGTTAPRTGLELFGKDLFLAQSADNQPTPSLVLGGTTDTYGDWELTSCQSGSQGISDTCHNNINDAFICGKDDTKTCNDWAQLTIGGTPRGYCKRSVKCVLDVKTYKINNQFGDLVFTNADGEKTLVIGQDGKIGIGTTPEVELEVAGYVKAYGYEGICEKGFQFSYSDLQWFSSNIYGSPVQQFADDTCNGDEYNKYTCGAEIKSCVDAYQEEVCTPDFCMTVYYKRDVSCNGFWAKNVYCKKI